MIHNKFRYLVTLVALFAMTAGAWADKKVFFPEGSIVYDFEAAANAGEDPGNKNGSAANGQAFYGWERSDRTDKDRQDYKGYEYAEGSKLPEVCHVWRRSDRISGNVANNGGLKCPSDKEMAVDGLVAGDKVVIVYDATNASDLNKNIIWAIGDGTTEGGPGEVRATATIGGVEAVTGQSVIPSGALIQVNKVTAAENGSGYIVFKVFKDMVIKQIAVIPAGIVFPVEPEGLEVTWDNATKTATIASMPAGDVELQVEYYPGMLVKPTNLVGGTLEIEGLTDTTLPEGFEKDDEGNIYVAKGTKFTVKAVPDEGFHLVSWSDDAENKELEREFTMTDDDFILTATFSDEYDLAFEALNANTIEDGKATVKVGDTDKTADIQDGKLSGVKYGQTVTLTAATGYKFRKAEAKKGGAAPATPEGPTLAQTLTTANMTVKVYYTYSDTNNTCEFLSNGDGTYTFQSGTGYVGGDNGKAKALVVENGKLVFKQNFYATIGQLWDKVGISITFDTSENTYSIWKGSNETLNPSLSKVEVNGTQIAVTQQ